MDQPDLDLLDAVLTMTIAVANGDQEAVELFLRENDPATLALTGADVIWRMAAALGQKFTPPRSPLQMIHIFAQAMRGLDDEFDAPDPS